MEFNELLLKRRSYRAFEPVEIKDELFLELISAASLAPSCYNNQPWRFVFVRDEELRKKMSTTYSKGNEWANEGSLIIAVYSNKSTDCIVSDREYYLFDTGMATMNLMLKAVELGYIVHPIAGYNESKAKTILNIPQDSTLITLIVLGKKSDTIPEYFNETQVELELKPSPRKDLNEIFSVDSL